MPTIIRFPGRLERAATAADPVRVAYDALAPAYDAFTAGHEYARWLDYLEGLAQENGLSGKALLDVGCGTGKSFLPMLEKGYDVVACDLSPEMAARARAKIPPDRAQVLVADMRDLPELGAFDLVTCLDDAINYATSRLELRATLMGFARNMRPGAIAVFDTNTLSTYRTVFAGTNALDSDGDFFCIRGEAPREFEPGSLASVWIEAFTERPDGLWERSRTRHLQRHHPRGDVEWALGEAGLELVAVRGQSVGAHMHVVPDEDRHTKIVYMARKPRSARG
jgi:SAM-dependent methyltransferase